MAAMHRFAAVMVSLALLLPAAAQAASGVVLPDFDPLDQLMDDLLSEQDRHDASLPFYESTDLFPAVDDTSDGTIGDQRDERTAGFLTILIGRTDVTLRDVPTKEWFAPYVRDLAELQLVSGYRDAQGMPTGL